MENPALVMSVAVQAGQWWAKFTAGNTGLTERASQVQTTASRDVECWHLASRSTVVDFERVQSRF